MQRSFLNRYSFNTVATILTRYGFQGERATNFTRISKDDFDAIRYDTIHRVYLWEGIFPTEPVKDPFMPDPGLRMGEFFTLVTLCADMSLLGYSPSSSEELVRTAVQRLEQERLLEYTAIPDDMTRTSFQQLGYPIKRRPSYGLYLNDAGVHRAHSLWQHMFPKGIKHAESLFFNRREYPDFTGHRHRLPLHSG